MNPAVGPPSLLSIRHGSHKTRPFILPCMVRCSETELVVFCFLKKCLSTLLEAVILQSLTTSRLQLLKACGLYLHECSGGGTFQSGRAVLPHLTHTQRTSLLHTSTPPAGLQVLQDPKCGVKNEP